MEEFIKYLNSLGYKNSIKNIRKLVKNVSDITKRTEIETLKGCDFKIEDKKIEKLEAILSELRAVVFLDNFNYKNIKLLEVSKNRRRPDIYAELPNKGNFYIEVTCLTEFHSRKPNGLSYILDNRKFKNEFLTRISAKEKQLKGIKSNYKMIIFVLNKFPEIALCNKKEYWEIIKDCYEEKQLENNYFLGFITGVNNEDFIYPNPL
jgi:DNA gyrase/topoisomerase IV subunit A